MSPLNLFFYNGLRRALTVGGVGHFEGDSVCHFGVDQPCLKERPRSEAKGLWYYCQKPEGYYPYIQRCPDGWIKVVPPASPPGR